MLRLLFPTLLMIALPLTVLAQARPEFPDSPHRAHQPPLGPPAKLQLPPVERFALPNGLEVLLVTRTTLPTVQIALDFPGGSQLDLPGQEGVTSLCTALAGESTRKLERLAFREALADLAANVATWASRDAMGVSLTVLKRNLAPALELWTDVVRNPGMREIDLAQLLAQRKAAIVQSKGSVGGVASRLQPVVAWGLTHPYGRPTTEKSLEATTVPLCQALWSQRIAPKGARLFVVGDVTRQELTASLTPLLGDWKGQTPTPNPIAPSLFHPHDLVIFDVPGSAQSAVQVMHPGPKRQDPEYPAISLMAAILGGGFASHINMNLREVHGWAYGARGGFDYQPHQSSWIAAASVRTDATGSALAEMLKEMMLMRDVSPTTAELERERDGKIAALPAKWATSDAILSSLRELEYYHLPLDDDARLPKKWRATQGKQVQSMAKKLLMPENSAVLVVGDLAKVLPQLQPLLNPGGILAGWKLVHVDADGHAVAQ